MKIFKKSINFDAWQIPEKINSSEIPKWVKEAETKGKIEIKEERGLMSLNTSPFEKIPEYPAVFINSKYGVTIIERGGYLVRKKKFFGYKIVAMVGAYESN